MKRRCSRLMGVVCFLGVQGLAFAGGTVTNTTQNGAWSSVSTWDNGVPVIADSQAFVTHVVGLTTAGRGTSSLNVGASAGAGTLNISSGDLTISSVTSVGTGGNIGTLNLSGGSLNPGILKMGSFVSAGFINMSGGSLSAATVDIPQSAPGSSASFVLSGGTLTLSGTIRVGDAANSSPGTLTIEGGAASFEGTTGGNDGTVHFTSESTLVIRPDGPMPNTNLTRINVGTVNIDTGATLELDPLYTPEVGDNWFIFISQNVVGGSAAIFTNVVTPAGVTISQIVAPTRGVPVGPEKMTVTVTAVPTPTTWVDFAHEGAEDGSVANPYKTLAGGLANVSAGGIIKIKGDTGVSFTAETPTISQEVTLQAPSGPVTIGITARAAGQSSGSGFVSRGIQR